MDALPPGGLPRDETVLPQPHVSRDLFERYVEEANSYAVDALKDSRRETKWWRWGCFAGFGTAAVLAATVAVVTARHTEHWGMLFAAETGPVRVIKDVRDVALTLPASVDGWFLEHYVQMREGWNEANADAAFQAVACMSDKDEQARFAAWYNKAAAAPQQVFARARRGWRTVETAEPGQVGVAAGGAKRVAVPFAWRDIGVGPAAEKPVTGTVYFTWRKDPRAAACNPAKIIVSDYERKIDREPQP